MSIEKPPRDTMMKAPPAKKSYHFSGDGVWEAQSILASSIEEAEKTWRETRTLVGGKAGEPGEITKPSEQP